MTFGVFSILPDAGRLTASGTDGIRRELDTLAEQRLK